MLPGEFHVFVLQRESSLPNECVNAWNIAGPNMLTTSLGIAWGTDTAHRDVFVAIPVVPVVVMRPDICVDVERKGAHLFSKAFSKLVQSPMRIRDSGVIKANTASYDIRTALLQLDFEFVKAYLRVELGYALLYAPRSDYSLFWPGFYSKRRGKPNGQKVPRGIA